jgi:hypothetical protein
MSTPEDNKPVQKKRTEVSPQQLADNNRQFCVNSWDLGKMRMACIQGVWRRVEVSAPPPQRLDVLLARKRDREWRAKNEQ